MNRQTRSPDMQGNARKSFILHYVLPGLLIFCIALFIRLYMTYFIGNAGDEFDRWYQGKRFLQGIGMNRLDHHTVRWSINIPMMLFQWVFGTKPAVYYFIPASFGALASLFVFNISRSIAGLSAGVFAAFLFTVTPQISSSGTQLMPAIFSCAYILGTAYFVLRYSEQKQSIHLVLAIVFMFLAYGSKVANLFFVPGILLFLYWRLRSIRPLAIFLSILALLYIIEIIGIAIYSGEFFLTGRIHYLSSHMDVMQSDRWAYSLPDIWKRWLILPEYWQYILIGSVVCGVFVLLTRFKEEKKGIVLIFLMLLSFSFISTFAITSIDPLRFVQPPITRYLTVTIPFAIIVLCCTVSLINVVLPLAVTIVLCWFWVKNYYDVQLKSTWTPAVLSSNAYQRTISDHYRNNYALLFKHPKNARLYQAAYLEDDILFRSDGSVEPIKKVSPKKFNFPTNNPYIYMISKTDNPIGYLQLTRAQTFKSKVEF